MSGQITPTRTATRFTSAVVTALIMVSPDAPTSVPRNGEVPDSLEGLPTAPDSFDYSSKAVSRRNR